MKKKLFIGITSWNSELFLDCCLSAVAKTTQGIGYLMVLNYLAKMLVSLKH